MKSNKMYAVIFAVQLAFSLIVLPVVEQQQADQHS